MGTVNPAKFDTYQWGPVKVGIHQAAVFDAKEAQNASTTISLNAKPPTDMFVGLTSNEKQSLAFLQINGKTEILHTPVYQGVKAILQKVADFLGEKFPKKAE